MLPKNLRSVALLPEILRISPCSRTSLPGKRLAVSLASIGKFFKISVVTAVPATDLS